LTGKRSGSGQENAQKSASIRYSTIPGSAFEVEFGEDTIDPLTNFLHILTLPPMKSFAQVTPHLPPRRAVTLEFVPNDDRVTPPMPPPLA